MEIPASYNQGTIDNQILKRAKQEIEEKTKDIKIKKGKYIEKIEIYFFCDEDRFKNKIKFEEIEQQTKIQKSTITKEEATETGLKHIAEIRKNLKGL